MIIEKSELKGVYTFQAYDGDRQLANMDVENLVVNEGIYTLVKYITTNPTESINWKFRIGTGREFTTKELRYSELTDDEIEIVDVGSTFFNFPVITLNGLVLSNEGFVETVKYVEDNEPAENTVTVGYKIDKVTEPLVTRDEFVSNVKLQDRTEKFDTTDFVNQDYISNIENQGYKVDYTPITMNVIDIGGWLNYVDNDKKWNNVSLYAEYGGEKFLFSRTVLPPFFKAKGVRFVIKYTLLI